VKQWDLCAVKNSPQLGLGREERKESSLKMQRRPDGSEEGYRKLLH